MQAQTKPSSFEDQVRELEAERPDYPQRVELVVFVNDDRAGYRCLVPDPTDERFPRFRSIRNLEDAVLDLIGDDRGPIRITVERI
jgi:hypothetical protein